MPFITSCRFITASTLLLAAFASGIPISVTPLQYEHLYQRGPTCSPVTLEQVQRLRGWNKLVQYAEQRWGSGGTPNVNPKEYLNRGIDACMNVATIEAQWGEEPTCEKTTAGQEGSTSGTELNASWQIQIGSSAKASWTVTRASEFTTSAEYSISAQIPLVADISSKFTFSGTVRDERSSSFESTNDMSVTQTFEYKNEGNKRCKFNVDTTTCKATATAKVPVVIGGRVWFFYGEARKDKVTNRPDGHYHWSVDISKVLSEEERTSYIEIRGPVNAQSNTVYSVDCVPINAAAKAVSKKSPSSGTTKSESAKAKSKDATSNTPKVKGPKAAKPPQAGKPTTPQSEVGDKSKTKNGKSSAARSERRSMPSRRR